MQFDRMCKKLLIKEPFWGLFMMGLTKIFTKEIPTLGVCRDGINVALLINEDFWNSLSDSDQMAVILHELHHLGFGHLLMCNDFPDKTKFNIAADMEVNCYISGLFESVDHVDAADYDLPYHQGTKWYYNNLPKNPENPFSKNQDNQSNNGDQQDNPQGSQNKGSNTLGDHSKWKDFSNLSDAQKELIKAQVDSHLRNAAKQVKYRNCGNIPNCMTSIIENLFKQTPPIRDWKADFKRLLGTSISMDLKKTYRRESKRLGIMPGIKPKKKAHILIAIDTSASIRENELSDFFTELYHIYKSGVNIHVLECNTKITADWEYNGSRTIDEVHGYRGGTSFHPVVNYYREHIKEYSLLVYFTDGYASIENLNVPSNNILWVLTSNCCKQDFPGKVIHIPIRK